MPSIALLSHLVRCCAVGCALVAFVGSSVAAEIERSTVPSFTLREPRGLERSLDDLVRDKSAVVVVFLGTECPLAKLYAPRLQALAEQFAERGVAVVGVMSNEQDAPTEVEHYARRHGIEFPLLMDPGAKVADLFAAERTPEAIVVDAERQVRYRGRIDDQFGVQYQRLVAERADLEIALEELVAGRDVSVARTEAPGCLIGRPLRPDGDDRVTWSGQIAAIFQTHCQDCHRPGQIGPFPLLTYDDVRGWGPMIRETVAARRMPPWHADPTYGHFVNDIRMSDEELALVEAWVEHGCPEGDPQTAPPPRQFVAGWQIPEPDQVVPMSDEPFVVPASGVVEYQWFEVDPGFTEDKWVKTVECRPGNVQVVHHITVYYQPPGVDFNLKLNQRINMLDGYSPGKRPTTDSHWDGTAHYLPAGTKLHFEMHYTPNGVEQSDLSTVALVFADPAEVQKQLSVVAIANTAFAIPPHADDYPVDASYTVDEDSLLFAMSPHMHLRGKQFSFTAQYPDGQREILLDVPRFEFNWQSSYRLVEPKRLPRGTILRCEARFDNSEQNLANPNPQATVHWGDQTWEEMMIGSVALAAADQDLRLGQGPPPRVFGTRYLMWALRLAPLGALIGLAAISVWWLRRHNNAQATPLAG